MVGRLSVLISTLGRLGVFARQVVFGKVERRGGRAGRTAASQPHAEVPLSPSSGKEGITGWTDFCGQRSSVDMKLIGDWSIHGCCICELGLPAATTVSFYGRMMAKQLAGSPSRAPRREPTVSWSRHRSWW
jgi:hypothetical protein